MALPGRRRPAAAATSARRPALALLSAAALAVATTTTAAFVALPAPAHAQQQQQQQPQPQPQQRGTTPLPPEPRRPRFTIARDSNSAGAYYYHGLSVIDRDPQQAADAFYWASRLDPDWADPYFARRVAMHLSNARNLDEYLDGVERARTAPERRRADSLSHRAFLIDPFLYRRLERRLVDKVLDDERRDLTRAYVERTGDDPGIMPANLDPARLAMHSPRLAAWVAYTNGNFPDALRYFADAIKRYPKAYDLHSERADVFFLLTRYDSALVELQTMLAQMRTLDDKKLIPFYDSKAFFEYEVGRVHAMRGDLAAAREAYGRALTEDLSFYMAHAAIGEIALVQHDTTAALAEFAQAVDLAADEPGLRYRYGVALFDAARYDAAAAQFRKAIELDPYYAKPYYPLAYILEGTGKDGEAVATYEGFLQRVPAADSAIAGEARKRLTELRASSPTAAGTSH